MIVLILFEIHKQYREAGADVIETNTFGATAIAQGDYGLADIAYELNLASARLARAACDEYSTPENMRPVVFSVTERGVIFVGDARELSEESRSTLAKAVAAARGTDRPPTERVGFGRT